MEDVLQAKPLCNSTEKVCGSYCVCVATLRDKKILQAHANFPPSAGCLPLSLIS